jgi:hypothetical protein
MRALDRPDVPVVLSTSKVIINIILDFLLLSEWRIIETATANKQAAVRLACDVAAVSAGLAYFLV